MICVTMASKRLCYYKHDIENNTNQFFPMPFFLMVMSHSESNVVYPGEDPYHSLFLRPPYHCTWVRALRTTGVHWGDLMYRSWIPNPQSMVAWRCSHHVGLPYRKSFFRFRGTLCPVKMASGSLLRRLLCRIHRSRWKENWLHSSSGPHAYRTERSAHPEGQTLYVHSPWSRARACVRWAWLTYTC